MSENCKSRYRNYATVVYPDSVVEGWQTILSESKVPILVSPLHDLDLNATGEPKKPHYHILVAFEGKKSEQQVKVFFESFGGVGLEVVQSLRGYARYLCHLDNPEKTPYPIDQVLAFGGIDYISTIGLPTDKYKIIGEIMDYINENNINAYCDILSYARLNHFDWFRVLCDSSTLVIKEYIKSKYWLNKNE